MWVIEDVSSPDVTVLPPPKRKRIKTSNAIVPHISVDDLRTCNKIVHLVDSNGRHIPKGKILLDERNDRLKVMVKREDAQIDHCVLCETTGGETVRCNICLDRCHTFCLVVFALGLESSFQFLGWRPPHAHDVKELAELHPLAGELSAELRETSKTQETAALNNTTPEKTIGFYCPSCESTRLGRDFVQCQYCCTDRYQTVIIKCATPRCSNGIHITCLMALEGLQGDHLFRNRKRQLASFAQGIKDNKAGSAFVKLADKTVMACNVIRKDYQDWVCGPCLVTAPESEDCTECVIPAQLLYNEYPPENPKLFDPVPTAEGRKQALNRMLYSERDKVRHTSWAQSWFYQPPILDSQKQFLLTPSDPDPITTSTASSPTSRPPSATPASSEMQQVWESLEMELEEAMIEWDDVHSVGLKMEMFEAKHRRIEDGLSVVTEMPLESPEMLLPPIAEAPLLGIYNEPIIRNEPLRSTPDSSTETAAPIECSVLLLPRENHTLDLTVELKADIDRQTDRCQLVTHDMYSKESQGALRWLDEHVNFRIILCYLFTALAKEFDEIEASDCPHQMRQLFGERWDPTSPLLEGDLTLARPLKDLKANDPGYPYFGVSVVSTGRSRYEDANDVKVLGKTIKQYDRTLQLPPLMYHLLLLYERLEELYGRSLFRNLWLSEQERDKFLKTSHFEEPRMLLSSWTDLVHNSYGLQIAKNPEETILNIAQGFRDLYDTLVQARLVFDDSRRKFLDELVYHPLVAEESNEAGSGIIRRYGDEIAFKIFKCFSRCGVLPPIEFDVNPTFGIYLRAKDRYKKYTIVGEYTGVVEAMRWNISAALQPSDSVYELVVHPNSRQSLCIVPEPYTGYVRYISGINNSKAESWEKKNVEALGFSIDNQLRLFVITQKELAPGQVFFLDYNAGPEALYPTEAFE